MSRAGIPEARHSPTNSALRSAHLPPMLPVSSIPLMSPTPHPRTVGSRYVLFTTQSYSARVLSTSVVLPATALDAVAATMPSVGMSAVGLRLRARSPVFAAGADFLLQSMSRSRVRMVLTTMITGDDSPSAQVARTIFAPYAGSVYSSASRRLPDHVLSCDCCHSV